MAYFRKRGGKWYFTISIPQQDGKYKKVERVGGKTKAEAEDKYRKLKSDYENGTELDNTKSISVHDVMDYWFENYVMKNLKYNTQNNYAGIIKNYIDPFLGSYDAKKLKPIKIQEFADSLPAHRISKHTIRIILTVLKEAINRAVIPYGFINHNPELFVEMPRMPYSVKRNQVKILSIENYNKILDSLDYNNPVRLPIIIAFNTGMRRGEVCALKWSDIDLDNRVIKVRHTMIDLKGHRVEITTPKTPASNRDIHFGDTLYNELIKYKLYQNNNKMLFKNYKESDLICTRADGKLVSPNTIKYHCDKISDRLKIEFHFHMLRHTHATLLLEHGSMPKEVQIRLGHSKLETTMNTYIHITEKTKNTLEIFSKKLIKKINPMCKFCRLSKKFFGKFSAKRLFLIFNKATNAYLPGFCSSSFCKTAMNAACGTSTLPTDFIRFFPRFCLSKSLARRSGSPV